MIGFEASNMCEIAAIVALQAVVAGRLANCLRNSWKLVVPFLFFSRDSHTTLISASVAVTPNLQ